MAKKERAAPHRIQVYPTQWRRWCVRAAQEGLRSVSALIRREMDTYVDGAQRRKKGTQ